MTVLHTTAPPPFPGARPAEPTPVTGPAATSAEIRAAAERLDLHGNRDVAAARTLAARLGQLAAAWRTT